MTTILVCYIDNISMAQRVSPSSQSTTEEPEDYEEKTLGKVIQYQTHLRRGL
jgi:hypothetical protein